MHHSPIVQSESKSKAGPAVIEVQQVSIPIRMDLGPNQRNGWLWRRCKVCHGAWFGPPRCPFSRCGEPIDIRGGGNLSSAEVENATGWLPRCVRLSR